MVRVFWCASIFCIYVGESLSQSVMFSRFETDLKHWLDCQDCQGWSSRLEVKVCCQDCFYDCCFCNTLHLVCQCFIFIYMETTPEAENGVVGVDGTFLRGSTSHPEKDMSEAREFLMALYDAGQLQARHLDILQSSSGFGGKDWDWFWEVCSIVLIKV